MMLLRYVALVALALWVGGLVALGAVAPTLFDVLEAQSGAQGRELAGLLFGTMLDRFLYIVWGLALGVLASLGLRAALGPRPRRVAIRTWAAAAMLGACLTVGFYIAPQIDGIRRAVHGPVASLPEADPRREAFGRLHGLSSGLLLATAILGLGLIWMEMTDSH
jgi:Domain of unknown function (DUF4149)